MLATSAIVVIETIGINVRIEKLSNTKINNDIKIIKMKKSLNFKSLFLKKEK